MSGLLAHRGMMLSGLRLSDGLYGFLPDLNAGATALTYSNNDRTITPTAAVNTTRYSNTSVMFPSVYGKYQFEYLIDNIGSASSQSRVGFSRNLSSVNAYNNAIIIRRDGQVVRYNADTLTTVNASGGVYTFTTGDILSFYFDFTSRSVEIAKNGTTILSDSTFFDRNPLCLVQPVVELGSTTTAPQPVITFIDGANGFNYPRGGYKPWLPYESSVGFDPAFSESPAIFKGDNTVGYLNTGTDTKTFSRLNKGYSSGKHAFYLVKTGTSSESSSSIGIVSESFDVFNATDLGGSGATANTSSVGVSFSYGSATINLSSNIDGATSTANNTTFTNGDMRDYISVAVDLDSSPKTVKFFVNGQQAHSFNLPNGKTWYPCVQMYNYQIIRHINVGQLPPLYTIPGYLNWDESLPVVNPPKDEYYSNVYIRNTFNTSRNTANDSKYNTINASGTPVISTSVKRFGEGALHFNDDATAQYITPARNVFTTTASATIEFWARASSTSHATAATVFYTGTLGTNIGTTGFRLVWANQTNYQLVANNNTDFTAVTGSTTILADTWYFIQVVRDGTTLSFYVDGVLQGSVTYTPSLTAPAYIGTGTSGNINTAWKGYIDDLRITRGVARPPHLPTTEMPIY